MHPDMHPVMHPVMHPDMRSKPAPGLFSQANLLYGLPDCFHRLVFRAGS